MLQANPQTDPIVEILRLAYRRGLAVRQEQVKEKAEAINLNPDEKPRDYLDLQPQKAQVQDGKSFDL